MGGEEGIGGVVDDAAGDLVVREGAELGVEQRDLVAGVDQWAADREETQRRQLLERDAAADGWVRGVEDQDTHGGPFACDWPRSKTSHAAAYFTMQSELRQ